MDTETKSADARLKRIKIVSRIVRYVVLANLVSIVCFQLLYSSNLIFSEMSPQSFLIISEALMCIWFWKLAQLFRFYGRGLIFAAETIRCIKSLGIICLLGWLTMTASHLLSLSELPPPGLPPGARVMGVHKHIFGFLSFNFGTSIDFGLLFIGASVVVAAWVMDEGRKIQEEQELTV